MRLSLDNESRHPRERQRERRNDRGPEASGGRESGSPRGYRNLDRRRFRRHTSRMLGPGASRRHIARGLNTAYADGLLSEETFAHRLDRVFADRLIDPRALIGDLNLRTAPRSVSQ